MVKRCEELAFRGLQAALRQVRLPELCGRHGRVAGRGPERPHHGRAEQRGARQRLLDP